MSKPYWHELPQKEVDELIANRTTVEYVMSHYAQPEWCDYSAALAGLMGCWSLTDNSHDGLRTKISREYCRGCDACNLSALEPVNT